MVIREQTLTGGKAIIEAARANGMTTLFGVKNPRIGIAALNPHAGEQGLFGDEEARVIMPAARAAQAHGILASDPMPADTLFGKAARGDYDAIVALYHDQGLIPLKMVAFGSCVNLTVGLPIIRTVMDKVEYTSLDGTNRFRMWKKLGQVQPA